VFGNFLATFLHVFAFFDNVLPICLAAFWQQLANMFGISLECRFACFLHIFWTVFCELAGICVAIVCYFFEIFCNFLAFVLATVCQLSGNLLATCSQFFDRRLAMIWQRFDFFLAIVWQAFGNLLATVGNCLTICCQLFGNF